jgi:small GTP-binding protein
MIFLKSFKKIYSLYCYFNNIGGIYSIIDEILYESEMNLNTKQIKYQATINILVLGRPGGGKSTLINLLLNERKAREGIGNSTTKLFSKYIHSKYPITFVDTPGFENDNDLNKMINFLNQTQTFFGEGKNKFHLVLYVINSSNERCFIGEEKKLISHIYTKIKIPIFFVCTRAQNENYASDFKEIIKVNLKQNFGIGTDLVEHIYYCHLFMKKMEYINDLVLMDCYKAFKFFLLIN